MTVWSCWGGACSVLPIRGGKHPAIFSKKSTPFKRGEEILIEARILSVADVVEAMASHRPYRPGLGIDAALHEIEKNREIYYDVAVADACLTLFREKGYRLAEA